MQHLYSDQMNWEQRIGSALFGGIIFGPAGTTAAALWSSVLFSADAAASEKMFRAGVISAFVAGLLLGPELNRAVRRNGKTSGLFCTFVAGMLLMPIFFGFFGVDPLLDNFEKEPFEFIGNLFGGMLFFGIVVTVMTFPFALVAGSIFTNAILTKTAPAGTREKCSHREV